MGRFSKGLLGPVSGTVGPVVGSSWKNKAYMRSQPLVKKRTSTTSQLDHQLKFSVIINFVNVLTSLLHITFKKYAETMSPNNAAVSYNYKHAIAGRTPDYKIDFRKALVSRGELPNVTQPTATATNAEVFFRWIDNSMVADAEATDGCILVAFCPNLNQVIFTTSQAVRSDAAATLNVAAFTGETIQTWIAFISAENKEVVSDSLYTGELVIG